MPDFTTVLSDAAVFDDSVRLAYDQAFLISNGQNQVLEQLVTVRKDINAKAVEIPVYPRLAAATTPLVDGEDVTSEGLTDTKVTITPVEYGNVVTKTTLASLWTGGIIDLAIAQVVGMNAGMTQDELVVAALQNATNILTVDNGAEAALEATDVMTIAFAQKMYNKLTRVHAPRIAGDFIAVMHEDVIADLRLDTSSGGWVDINKYSNAVEVLKNEVGRIPGFRVVSYSTDSLITNGGGSGTVDTYRSYFLGANALGKGVSRDIGFVAKPAGDKLSRLFHVGWYGVFAYALIDQSCVWEGITGASLGLNS